MSVFQLEKDNVYFPLPTLGEPDGLLAIGGDLSIDRLLLAYSNGIFPWYNSDQPIMWWCPMERFIIRPSGIHISHSMKKYMRKHHVEYRLDRDFAHTMHQCRVKRESEPEGTWISDDMEKAYQRLHDAGFAFSIESYVDGNIAGGLYGVNLGKCFFGESMYSDLENGSKLALIALAKVLEEYDYNMIDCQFHTDHLESMGGVHISYEEYRKLLPS
ncbi:MAG TPA: leucyl/phenylalanyl-tRNA--protein transferase [Lachnospiraceae bacterium]|nr:leucyl/phenylalanyl-tRNA--protein transferase [Lachnospiraceae bacterium]